jgi:cation diffusion facilitator CzcD-associated flavoprotein CzcO
MGYHLQTTCPGRSYAILERRERIGGTWDLFRYPGIRSDSDMHTLGYSFRPWANPKAIADGPSILQYLDETAREYGIDRKIRFGLQVKRASWSSADARWTVEAERCDGGEVVRFTCGFLFMASGYYDYDAGYTPEIAGTEAFQGRIVHPQKWSDDVEYAGKRVVVIGSGATAVTLVPELAKQAAHVTMLQRSPTYMVVMPSEDPVANFLRRFLPGGLAHQLTKWKNVLLGAFFFWFCRKNPERAKLWFRQGVRKALGPRADLAEHFEPTYNPWQQRVCLVPDNDLFDALIEERASIVTDRIDTFTERGLRLTSGRELEADLIVTATGLQLKLLGGLDVHVDGKHVNFADTFTYKGMMFSGVPNLALAMGYTNASWTLKCDLTCAWVCRLLNAMEAKGADRCRPRAGGPGVPADPMLDFNSGYIQRSLHLFPKQGPTVPWRALQNYLRDVWTVGWGSMDCDALEFSRRPARGGLRAVEQTGEEMPAAQRAVG